MKKRCFCLALIAGLLFVSGLFATQQPDVIQFLYPKPGSEHVSNQASIILRLNNISANDIVNRFACIRVRGEQSGLHSGRIKIAADLKTLTFKPDQSFTPGETVRVSLSPKTHNSVQVMNPFGFQFTVKESQNNIFYPEEMEAPELIEPPPFEGIRFNESRSLKALAANNGVSVPSDFPLVSVTVNNNPDSGYIFLNNWGGQPYNIILDSSGAPIWYLRTWDKRRDFKKQDNGTLTMLIRGGYGRPQVDNPVNWGHINLDNNYTIIDTFRATMGYLTDEHECQIFEDGSYFIIGRIEETVDMSQYVEGGRTNATVRETMIQGFTPEGDLNFTWAAWDHFDIRDMQSPDEPLTSYNIRFPHMNAIDKDEDGHILLSSRHLSEVTKINRETGEKIWRLGGANNQFTFINDPLNGFSNQHDIRSVGDNRYTVFDNGNQHSPRISRAVEYELDTLAMTATLVWEYQNPYDGFSHYMGNAQRQSNGNTVINWAEGFLPKVSEITPDGEIAFEMWASQGFNTYRVLKDPWDGIALKPYLIVEPHKEAVVFFMNQFGDPNVNHYRIYGGTSPNPTTLIDTSNSSLKSVADLENPQNWFFRVTSVNGSGVESDYSNEEEAFVSVVAPGENMVLNGDFSNRKNNWFYNVFGGASANWLIEDGVSHFNISASGPYSSTVQLVQLGMELIQGEKYIFEFDAWADAPRTIDAWIFEYGDDYTDYGQIGPTYITPGVEHFSFPFTMEDQSDFNAIVVFLMGHSDIDVYLDNVSFKRNLNSAVGEPEIQSVTDFRLLGNYPNPFNSQTTIRFETEGQSHVNIQLYDILGRLQFTICDQQFEPGNHSVNIDGSQLSSGIYFYQVDAKDVNGQHRTSQVSKIMLIK
ncbi:aryl-sulfate sulfotransferase [candidate division KSB1 bacterium]|nr:aryl-sulfate sulfotransferase [candidate division KSB1 bacterium]